MIGANEVRNVKLTYKTDIQGVYRGHIFVDCAGNLPNKDTINVTATTIEYFIFLINENGE